ncbi:hypothetical protein L596_025142 [Steinernema carpocapsae]|uniref:MGAT4 conserved region domain-containing protein n=1 Tax=Steinernema carpocapsae TaxID=34508 RepID=A0A4V5ZYQ6_STECR|nr:hypothetical protein L596_025142 [Steinernema carpocapsae]
MVRRSCSTRAFVLKVLLVVFLIFVVRKWTQYELDAEYKKRVSDFMALSFRSPMETSHEREFGDLSKEPKHLVPFALYDVLPHLKKLSSNTLLNPDMPVNKAKGNNGSKPIVVVGIPSVFRAEVNYLRTTLDSLFENLRPSDAQITKFVVMLAEIDAEKDRKIEAVTSDLEKYFQAQIDDGLLEVIVPPKEWYPPNLDRLTPTFNDSPERMYWRTKQNLDYAYLMLYVSHFYSHSKYYLQLEDDIGTVEDYIPKIISYVESVQTTWLTCEFSKLGFIGKLFHVYDLPLVYRFILMFHADKPVDWLLDQLFEVRYCHHEEKDCVKKRINNVVRKYAKPPLFQHLGRFSSLKGKKQNLREAIGKYRIKTDSLDTTKSGNPSLKYTDSSTNHGSGALTDPYTSSGHFLLSSPHAGDFFLYHFNRYVSLFSLKVTLCQPLSKPLNVMVFRTPRLENGKRIKGAQEEIFWTNTSTIEMEYVAGKEKMLKISEVILEVASDAAPVCIARIEIKFEV